jgi:hypothetical protein
VYAFTPTAADPNGSKLTFAINNAPPWSAFDTSTGRLSGTPGEANVGTYAAITIMVTDSNGTATLPAFTITVMQAQAATGSATLVWTPPTVNSDGSPLMNLAGYRIYYGHAANSLTQSVQLANPGLSSYMLQSLSSGTWFFAVKSYTQNGAESSLSNVASKTIS